MKTRTKNNYNKLKSKNPFKKKWDGVPATVRQTLFEKSLYESFFASIFWHVIFFLILWALAASFLFFGITPKIFPMQKNKIKDIEFNISDSGYSRKSHRRIRQQDIADSINEASNTQVAKQINKSTYKSNNKSNVKDSNEAIPDFSTAGLKSIKSGLGGSGRSRRASGLDSSSISGSDSSSRFSDGNSSSGNSGFDKSSAKKVITTFDISPYVNELKRNIRWNWKATKGYENKKVELFLRIAKDGRLIILNVKRTSEVGEVDNAALNAVRKCVPLNPLPSKYNKNYLDVIFTFGSSSVGSRY